MKNTYLRVTLGMAAGFLLLWGLERYGVEFLTHPETNYSSWIHSLYPSLPSKLRSLGTDTVSGFLSQVKWRWLMVSMVGLYMFKYARPKPDGRIDLKQSRFLIQLLVLSQFLYLPDLYKELLLRHQWRAFYEPVHFWGLLMPSYPPVWFIAGCLVVIGGSACFLFLEAGKSQNRWQLVSAFLIPIGWTLLLAAFFGFHKIDHTYSTLYLGLWMLPILVHSLHRPEYLHFSVRLLQAGIWGTYFFAGLEKLFLSGFDWMDPIHFQQLAFLHPTPVSQWMANVSWVGSVVLGAGFLFQLLSVLQWRFAFWGYMNVVGGLAFHLGTWLIFDIGGWQSPWILMLIFLWPGWLKSPGSEANKAP